MSCPDDVKEPLEGAPLSPAGLPLLEDLPPLPPPEKQELLEMVGFTPTAAAEIIAGINPDDTRGDLADYVSGYGNSRPDIAGDEAQADIFYAQLLVYGLCPSAAEWYIAPEFEDIRRRGTASEWMLETVLYDLEFIDEREGRKYKERLRTEQIANGKIRK